MASAATGGNFWQGMGQGMMTTGLNHAAWETVATLKGKLPKVTGLKRDMGDYIESSGCSESVAQSIAKYKGIDLPGSTLSTEGVDFRQAAEKLGLEVIDVQHYNEWVDQIKSDNPVAATYTPTGGRAHTVGIERVQQRGREVRLRIMDPDPIPTGRARRINVPMNTIFQGTNIRRAIK